jgi:hypothetical protein
MEAYLKALASLWHENSCAPVNQTAIRFPA